MPLVEWTSAVTVHVRSFFLCGVCTGIESASRAMELVNGYILHDKPLVVSYGHRRTQTMELK